MEFWELVNCIENSSVAVGREHDLAPLLKDDVAVEGESRKDCLVKEDDVLLRCSKITMLFKKLYSLDMVDRARHHQQFALHFALRRRTDSVGQHLDSDKLLSEDLKERFVGRRANTEETLWLV